MALNGYSWWKYPQKPVRINQQVLQNLNPDDYTMEPKIDGHRVVLIAGTSQVYVYTRQKRRIQPPNYLMDELRSINFPAGTVLDGEIWNIAKRGGWKKFDRDGFSITFWDTIRTGTVDLSSSSLEDRRDALFSLLNRETEHVLRTEILKPSMAIVESLHQKAREVRDSPDIRSGYIHGVVLKKNGSPRRDHATRSTKHPDWLKYVFPQMEGWEPKIT